MKSRLACLMAALLAAGFCFASGDKAAAPPPPDDTATTVTVVSGATPPTTSRQVVASTAWVGAMLEAAGLRPIRILAPLELRHPAEYDFRPSDIQYVLAADEVVWAGYEGFVRQLIQAAPIPAERLVAVYTDNTPPRLRQEVAALAERFGTQVWFQGWATRLDVLAGRLQAGARRVNANGIRLAVHVHYKALAEWLGYTVVAEIGMGELTPQRLQAILDAKPDLVIDNWHMPNGAPLQGLVPRYVGLINFPGPLAPTGLLEVLEYNGRQLGLLE